MDASFPTPAGEPGLPTEKQALRAVMRQRRRDLPVGQRNAAGNRIGQWVRELPEVAEAQTIALYASFGSEVRTHELIRQLTALGKRIVLPRVIHWKRELELHVVPDFPQGCEKGDFGILEPTPEAHPECVTVAMVDLLFVPGLVFDRAGYRIGYGGGYYDRLLRNPHRAAVFGLAFDCQLVAAFDREAWDRPVQAVVTEAGVVRCGG